MNWVQLKVEFIGMWTHIARMTDAYQRIKQNQSTLKV